MLGHYTYLAIILIPGIPGIVFTWLLGRKILFPRAKVILATVAILTVYFAAIDVLAMKRLHIWEFKADSLTGIVMAGDYLEEWILFIVTQTLTGLLVILT